MRRLAVELIPRDRARLLDDYAAAREALPEMTDVNLPDLLRMPLRSWEGASALRSAGASGVIPHIRATDIAPDGPLPGTGEPELREILVVAGDPPPDETHRTYPNTSIEIIARYRREAPHLKVYAAFDPYRRAPYLELEEVQRKRDAGAAGFFTQPLFDRRMLELSAEWLADDTVFWGVSPVVGPKSRAYWERVNHVVFPRDFDTGLDANVAFAREVLNFAKVRGDNAYLMPLRVDLAAYLGPLRDVFF